MVQMLVVSSMFWAFRIMLNLIYNDIDKLVEASCLRCRLYKELTKFELNLYFGTKAI
jgi:hypothetical protein